MDDNIKFIDNFYNNPFEITNKEYKLIKKLLDKYKKEIIENKYFLYVAENDIIQKLFILFLFYINYYFKINKLKKIHSGCDFEFNQRKIALMQLKIGKYVWIINPSKYDRNKINILNEKLLL